MKIGRFWLVAAVAWMAMIAVLSSVPDADGSRGIGPWDKPAHLFAYGALAMLLARGLFADGMRHGWQVATIAALATLYGMTDELHQSFVPGREASLGDLLADLAGAASAATALFWRNARRLAPDPETAS